MVTCRGIVHESRRRLVAALIVAVLGVAGLVAPPVTAAAVVNDPGTLLAPTGGLDRLDSECLSQLVGQGRPRVSAASSRMPRSEAEPLDGLKRSLARHAFRLGTAAGPFGWSTAVADLNRDGEPDIAVVDSVGRTSRGYAYRIELMVSAVAEYAVGFETAHPSVLVAVRDVDRDRDPDLVVTSPLVSDVIGVWLNDGDGRFEQTGAPPPSVRTPPASRFVSPRPAAASTAVARAAGWRDEVLCRVSGVIVARVAAHVRSCMPEPCARCVRLSESLASRAPPARLG
jgi:hypothetical protein